MAIKGNGDFPVNSFNRMKRTLIKKVQWGDNDSSIFTALNNYFFGTSVLQRWNGSQWVIAELKRYNSTNWVDAKLNVFDGTDWITVTTA